MPKTDELFTSRKSLGDICTVPEKIISVYSLEKHVWAESNSEAARRVRKPELQTVEEFQLDPVRPFLTDILRNMAAPYIADRKDKPIGQGYWVQAEFGSGKSHLLCFLSALAMGKQEAWDIVRNKEEKAGRGKRESLYRFWEEGLAEKNIKGKKGLFVVVKTLVGSGGGTVGLVDQGKRLAEYIIDAFKEQIQLELGKNLSLYPAELLADRFVAEDVDRYRNDLKKFLCDPKFFELDEFEDVDAFVRDIQQNKSPEYKKSCGSKLWRFYTEYLKVQPQIPGETEDILKHVVETIMAEGYSGVLLVLDEVSLFMVNRTEQQRWEDAKALVVLANRLAKIYNLPVWTICSAQQRIEARIGERNIIADDRLKLVKLLENPEDYYNIVLSRVRAIKDPSSVGNYFLYYKRGFTWPISIGEKEFSRFFPFHKPALEVLQAISYNLTTTRSAIAVMHQVLKHLIKHNGRELIRLWELFDETVRYEEDPSGTYASLSAIKTQFDTEYRAYDACRKQIEALTKGYLKVHREKAVKVIQTLFLYHVSRTRQLGLSAEELANAVLIERDGDANPEENIQHYETLAENLKKELRQIVQTFDEDRKAHYRFDPVFTGVDPRKEFRKAREEAEANELMLKEAWEHLLALDEWPVRTRQMTIDLSHDVQSIFRNIATYVAPWKSGLTSKSGEQSIEFNWNGRAITGLVGMRDLEKVAAENIALPTIDSDQTDHDFSIFVSTKPIPQKSISKLLERRKDPRLIIWTPDRLTPEERDRLTDFAAYRKLVSDWQGKETEDAIAVINWVANSLQSDLGKIAKIVESSYARGRVDTLNNSQMEFHVAGELSSIVTPLVDRILSGAYESREIKFDPPFIFRREEGIKVINGIVKTGIIPKGVKPNQNISAAQNFGFGLKIMKKGADKQLDVSDNPFVKDIWDFIDTKLADPGQSMKVETLYKNFMGIGGPKDYGLTRRMVELYLLCLVQQGKVRVSVGAKSGLATPIIDYANLADIEFSTKVLDALTEVQKLARPENWETLRTYAEKLLGEPILTTHDDAVISSYRTKLRELFVREKEEASRWVGKAHGLFEVLGTQNPYDKELGQVFMLFSTDISTGDDINTLLYALKESMGYQAYDTGNPSQAEVDDLANRLKNYRDLQRFVGFDSELRTLQAYCGLSLPDITDLKEARKIIQKLTEKKTSLQTYIDSDVKLRTELIGKTPPEAGETRTLGTLIQEYSTVYVNLHDTVLEAAEKCRKKIDDILQGDELKALKILERIPALKPAVSDDVERNLEGLASNIFTCSSPSKASIEDQLRHGIVHDCGISFSNYSEHEQGAQLAAKKAVALFNAALDRKLELFMNETVRARLEKGKSEPVIANLLKSTKLSEVRAHLVKACVAEPSMVDKITRYLKQVVVKSLRIADFKPSVATVEKHQIPVVVDEFKKYLENGMQSIESGEESLPMLQIE
jgi:hypothetical protein